MDKEKIINKIEKIEFELNNYEFGTHSKRTTAKKITDRICYLIHRKNKLLAKLGTPAEVNKPQSEDMT